jgi:hypothetical protein
MQQEDCNRFNDMLPMSHKHHHFCPVDHTIRKAIVITMPGQLYNHPLYPLEKLTFAAIEDYQAAIKAVGALGRTVTDIDKGMLTKHLFSAAA